MNTTDITPLTPARAIRMRTGVVRAAIRRAMRIAQRNTVGDGRQFVLDMQRLRTVEVLEVRAEQHAAVVRPTGGQGLRYLAHLEDLRVEVAQ